MNAADEAADPFERLLVAELGRATAAARVDRYAEIGEAQRMHGCDDGNLALGELVREGVLLVDLGVAPAAGTVELGDHHRAVLEPDLVHAILVAVETEQAPIRTQARGGDPVEHPVRREP